MRFAACNIDRNKLTSAFGKSAVGLLLSLSPEVVILTEAWSCYLGGSFHYVDSGSPISDHLHPSEREIVIASSWPLRELKIPFNVSTPGKCISTMIDTPRGTIRVIGIYIPWWSARAGTQRSGSQGDIRAFLRGLAPVLEEAAGEPCIVASNFFNQSIPSEEAEEFNRLIKEDFESFQIQIPEVPLGTRRLPIVDIAFSHHLNPSPQQEWPREIAGLKFREMGGKLVEVEQEQNGAGETGENFQS